MLRLFAFTALLILLSPVAALAATLNLELADDRVDITTGFNGTKIVVFGTTDVPDPDLAIILKGPEKKVVVRRKGRVMGTWFNTKSVEFRRVPSYYDYATTKADASLAPDTVLEENQIGLDHLDFYPEDDSEDGAVVDTFHDALISELQQKGFFSLKASTITFMQPQFFKVIFDLPAGVPTGLYSVEGLLLENGKVEARESKNLQVGQVGFNARVYLFATRDAFWYAIFSIFLALFTGWSAFTFLRRD